MFCPKCGKQIADGSKFCPKCGAAVQAKQASGANGGAERAVKKQETSDTPFPKPSPSRPKNIAAFRPQDGYETLFLFTELIICAYVLIMSYMLVFGIHSSIYWRTFLVSNALNQEMTGPLLVLVESSWASSNTPFLIFMIGRVVFPFLDYPFGTRIQGSQKRRFGIPAGSTIMLIMDAMVFGAGFVELRNRYARYNSIVNLVSVTITTAGWLYIMMLAVLAICVVIRFALFFSKANRAMTMRLR